jgi:hypothetical protein
MALLISESIGSSERPSVDSTKSPAGTPETRNQSLLLWRFKNCIVRCVRACVRTWLHLGLAVNVGGVLWLVPPGLGDPDQSAVPPQQVQALTGQVPARA